MREERGGRGRGEREDERETDRQTDRQRNVIFVSVKKKKKKKKSEWAKSVLAIHPGVARLPVECASMRLSPRPVPLSEI